MGYSQTQHNLPIIDFNNEENVKPGTASWLSTCNQVRYALEEYGSFIILYDKVQEKLNNAILLALEELFDLPTETKMLNSSNIPAFGYIGRAPDRPLHESMAINESTNLEAVQRFTNLMWPSGNSNFSASVHSYAKDISQISKVVMRMILESYGLEKYIYSQLKSWNNVMRLNKYEASNVNEHVGVSAHTDLNFLTILHQVKPVQGLELKPRSGSWISVDIPPSSFVINAADGMRAWSNGRIHSAIHRVTMTAEEERYSIGMFVYHNEALHVPEELVDEDHPLQFKSFDQFGYFRFVTLNQSLQNDERIKVYCGI